MNTQVFLPISICCFGNTWYRSVKAEEKQYALEVTKATLVIRRKAAGKHPGLFLIYTGIDIPGIQVARNPTDGNSFLVLNIELTERCTLPNHWCHCRLLTQEPVTGGVAGGVAPSPARFFAIFDSNDPNIRRDWTTAVSLMSKMTNVVEKNARFFVDLLDLPDIKVLDYPQPWSVTVYKKDMQRLERNGWLNDTVVDVGLRAWYHRITQWKPAQAEKVWVTSSFFFQKLYRKNLRADYDKVKKWEKKMKIFDREYLVVPINSNNTHWYLAVICHPSRVLEAPPIQCPPLPALWREPPGGVEPPSVLTKCTIVIMDSLGGSHTRCVRAFREFLQDAAEAHCGQILDTRKEGGRVEAIYLPVPQQKNSFDCGLFLLLFAEAFIAHADELLNSPTILLQSVWENYKIEGRRERFKGFVEEELENWMSRNGEASLDAAV